jgi:hypothetical protein
LGTGELAEGTVARMGMTPAIDVLLDARKLLARTDGWIQGAQTQMVDGTVAYCIEGALEAAAPEVSLHSDVWDRVAGVISYSIPAYNDVPGRRQSEVLEIIDRAIQAEWRGDPLPSVAHNELPIDVLELLKAASHVVPPDAAISPDAA